MVPRYADWVAAGGVRPLSVEGRSRSVFVREIGDRGSEGAAIVLVHGFPTSSFDWAPLLPRLAGHRLVLMDLLGFGATDKPRDQAYSIHGQADLVEAVLRDTGVGRGVLVAHDYGATVALELLARQSDGASSARFDAAVLLNGGLYHDLHRPRPIQKLLLNRLAGPLVARLLDERRFVRAMAEVFGPANPPGEGELREHWQAVAAGGGHRIGHRLIHYIRDRKRHAARWEAALERPPARLTFAWGLSDPISGAHMLERIRRRCAGADIRAWDGVGHYPQLEAADRVADAILDAARTAGVAPA